MTHPVDIHVGKRIRHQRWLKGITQQHLAEQVGIKFQQIQKYETGANRVSASRLWDIANAMGVPVTFFFEGLKEAESEGSKIDNQAEAEVLRCYRASGNDAKLAIERLLQATATTGPRSAA